MTLDQQITGIVETAVRAVLGDILAELRQQTAVEAQRDPDRIFWPEADAARCLGVSPLTLRNLRLNGQVRATCNRRPVRYTWNDIERIAEQMAKEGCE